MNLVGYKSSTKGFTLIELMVVISIIGILAAVLYVNFSESRKIARDRTRMASLKQLQIAVTLYKEQYGRYPEQGCGTVGVQWAGRGTHPSWGASCDDYILGLVPDFISSLPVDPISEDVYGKGFIYKTDTNGSVYKIMVHRSVESNFITSYSDEYSRCPSVSESCATIDLISNIYAVYSAGAEAW